MSRDTQAKDKKNDITMLNKKRAVVMLLGNQCDIDSLVSMLEKETDNRLLLHIITTLGSLGRIECIPHLEKMLDKLEDPKLLDAIKSSIKTINKISSYGSE